MTGYTVHTGTSEKFSNGWDRIFGDKPQSGSGTTKGKKSGKKQSDKVKKVKAEKKSDTKAKAGKSGKTKKK
ncbi:hypothetical protein [Rubinisphaera margarita]|uniref:hypothetical protein n=1 Tax=Rubinisphaera margarita TaxID=2909586 RepID=UPI001EE875EB|nr:hypothetical protein [Rubinisphaera margarita]MCG6155619.1 hypothetical protein [Rubinisphaera margarita]